ncbi:MAG: ferritin family protein [Thermoplasmatota archaeon]
MDLSKYTLEELLLAAIKSEVESAAVYNQLASKVTNGFLSDKLMFIAGEEKKHQDFLESVYRMNVQKEPVLPRSTPVPLPDIRITNPSALPSDIMFQAMTAEEAAADFYGSLAKRFEDSETRKMLEYLSQMEIGHFKLLELEKEQLDKEEEYEIEWEMMHAGP